MINGYKIAKVRELHGLNNYQCFMVGAVKEWEGSAKMTITQLMAIAKIAKVGCHATIHKALMESIKDGFLKVEQSERDGRTKFLSMTKKAEQYLNDLNKGVGK
jgi:DNA-binding MarR family transcriptional regulator